MNKLSFQYQMNIVFSAAVEKHHFSLRCIPGNNGRQLMENLLVSVSPNKFTGRVKDAFGNECVYGYMEEKHNMFSVLVQGVITTGLQDMEQAAPEHQLGMYKKNTSMTLPGETIKRYHAGFTAAGSEGNFARAMTFMEKLHDDFVYKAGVTNVATTAEAALAGGQGVCQDYAHILLSLCRLERIPCRYVAGVMIGEGLSHAWVEVYDAGYWRGIDPTNRCLALDNYIKFSHGRDCRDCQINRGIFLGAATQTQNISVSVSAI